MLKIEIQNNAISQALDRIAQNFGDVRPALKDIGETIASEVDLCFRDAQDPYGNPWQELSEVTIAKRRKGSDKPLNDTGRLKNSITANVVDSHTVEAAPVSSTSSVANRL